MNDIIENELPNLIEQAAAEVHQHLGPGFPEKIYEEALIRELTSRHILVEKQKPIVVYYKEEPLGEFMFDLVANQSIILELKAEPEILPSHERQANTFLKATGLPLAIVINFGAAAVQFSRVVNNGESPFSRNRTPRVRHIMK